MKAKLNLTPQMSKPAFNPNLKQAKKFFSKQELTGSVLGQKMPTGAAPVPTDPATATGYGRTK